MTALTHLLHRCTLALDVAAAAEIAAQPASPDDLTLEDGAAFDAYRRDLLRSGGDGQRVCADAAAVAPRPQPAWPDSEGWRAWCGLRQWSRGLGVWCDGRHAPTYDAHRPADSHSYAGHCGGDPDMAEIIAVLAAATPNDITVLDYASTFGDQRYRLASGWEVVVNWRRGEPNYIDEVRAPDGRRWDFDHMHYEVRDWCRFLEFMERWPWCRDVRANYPEEVRARSRMWRMVNTVRATSPNLAALAEAASSAAAALSALISRPGVRGAP